MMYITRAPLFAQPAAHHHHQQRASFGGPSIYNLFSEIERSLNDAASAPSANSSPCQGRRRQHVRRNVRVPFDISETAEAYQLVGEVPGFEQADLNIEFTDRETLQISGKRSRITTKSSQAPAAEAAAPTAVENGEQKAVEDAPAAPASDAMETESTTKSHMETESTTKSHQASVEDDFEDLGNSSDTLSTGSGPTSEKTPAVTEKSAEQEEQQEQQEVSEKQSDVTTTEDKTTGSRYWVTERVSGEFQRTFSFAHRIDQNAVKASLKDGILQIVVPKVEPEGPKRINIE